MKLETKAPSRIAIVFVVLLSGCLSVQKKEQLTLPIHCAREISSASILVRTGGLFEKPHDIYRQGNEQVTLRQALLESGGVRQPEQVELTQAPVVQQVRATALAPNPSPRSDSLEVLDSIFADKPRVLGYFDVFQINGIFRDGYDASLSSDPLEYLQDTLASLTNVVKFPNRRMTEEWYNQDVSDWNGLLSMAEKPFGAFRENDSEFADSAIAKLRSLKTGSVSAVAGTQ